MWLLRSLKLFTKNFRQLFPWTFTEDQWCSDSSVWQKDSCASRSFLTVRQDGEYRKCADSFQMHFWFVWVPQRHIENKNITAVYPLTLLLRLKMKTMFFSLLLRKSSKEIYRARFYLPIYTKNRDYYWKLIAFGLKTVKLWQSFILFSI